MDWHDLVASPSLKLPRLNLAFSHGVKAESRAWFLSALRNLVANFLNLLKMVPDHSDGTQMSEGILHISFCEPMHKLNSSSFHFPSSLVAEAMGSQRRVQLPTIMEKDVLQIKSLSSTISCTT